jgi:predicted DCC family thiol-disulfide oxidoreductase YuxK
MIQSATPSPLVLFDGVCNLCSRTVIFIIKRDSQKIFKFASLQSSVGQDLLKKFNLPPDILETFLLIENDACYMRSTAALKIAKRLRRPWPLLYVFIIVPKFMRDFIYNLIARNRYKLFGKRTECFVPTNDIKARFID